MASQAVGAGTLAAAVLGAGTVAATNPAGDTTVKSGSATASQVVQELARTGVDFTTLLAVLGALMVLAGLLLVGLTRRHGTRGTVPAGFALPELA